ncbi:MAG TPA: hypothetical protein VMD30_11765 [Tepidisphaeraceae bacterium]|nr:hypothetical protein [Tepidisphaeraceae bacterium]
MQKYLEQLKVILKVAQKHLVSVICGVLAILAVIACYWPTQNFYYGPTGLVQNVQESLAAIQTIKRLQMTPRSLPVMDPGQPAQPLNYFPNRSLVEWGETEVKWLQTQSQAMLADAIKLNAHVPLYVQAFYSGPPDHRVEGTAEARTEFAKLYLDATASNGNLPGDQRIRNWPAPEAQNNRPRDEQIPPLKPGIAPTDADVTAALNALQQKINDTTLQPLPTTGQPSPESLQLAQDEYTQQSKPVLLNVAMQVAEECKVYLEPGALKEPANVSTFSGTTQAPTSQDIWDAQRCLWIDEDVATAVAYANEDAANVLDSPVKQIVDVEFPTPYVFSAPTDQSGIKDDGQVPLMFAQSSTGHVSNGMYDVIHFTVVLDVDAGKIPDVLWNMQRGQFITVMDYHSKTVDTASLLLTGQQNGGLAGGGQGGAGQGNSHFVYGQSPVVELTMDCEELMLDGWVSQFAPPAVTTITPQQ